MHFSLLVPQVRCIQASTYSAPTVINGTTDDCLVCSAGCQLDVVDAQLGMLTELNGRCTTQEQELLCAAHQLKMSKQRNIELEERISMLEEKLTELNGRCTTQEQEFLCAAHQLKQSGQRNIKLEERISMLEQDLKAQNEHATSEQGQVWRSSKD